MPGLSLKHISCVNHSFKCETLSHQSCINPSKFIPFGQHGKHICTLAHIKWRLHDLYPRVFLISIFCSGVVHHTADPVRALQELKSKLKPDGVLYLMLYSQFGRRPTMLMQRAIKMLSRNPKDQQEGLQVGRMLFDALPSTNPIATWEREKWSDNHRAHPEAFIDMYVNANEKNYSIREVYADLAAAGLQFVRFDKP